MPIAKRAPAGQHSEVTVTVTLQNGRRVTAAWTCPYALSWVHAKAPRWIREHLTAQKIPGRSKIVAIVTHAEYYDGEFEGGDES